MCKIYIHVIMYYIIIYLILPCRKLPSGGEEGVALTDHMTLTTAICIVSHMNLCNSWAFKASLHWSSGLNSLGAVGCHGSTGVWKESPKKGGGSTESAWSIFKQPSHLGHKLSFLSQISVWKCLTLKWGMWSGRSPSHLTYEAKWRQDAWLPAHAPALVLANSMHGVSATWLQSWQSSMKFCIIFREQAQASDFTIRLLDSWLFHHLYPWRFQRNRNHAKTAFRWANLLNPVFNLL